MKRNNKGIHFEHYRGNEEFVKRIYDLLDLTEKRKRAIITPFFSPDQSAIVETICGNQIAFRKDGGYAQAERNRFAFLPFDEEVIFPTVLLKANYSSTFSSIGHRDVLGALMNLGIEREKIGDIFVSNHDIQIIIDEEIENYIVCNLTKIKRNHVHFERSTNIIEHTSTILYSHKIVSSLRLDAIVSACTNVSRAKAQDFIASGRVKVNHVVLEQTSYMCNNNSAISIRGYGRYHFAEVIKRTKKEHYVIDVGVYE